MTARFREHHAFLLARMLAHVEALEADIDVLSQRIAELVEPWAGHLTILDSITGVGPRAAEVILAEIGPDMTRFPTAGHLASWAGRCPGQRESAGRRGSAKPRKGSPWLADVLTECAWAAVKTKDTYLSAYYRQVMRRQGKQKAIMAVTHKILVIAWHLLSNGALYDDPGAAARAQEQRRATTPPGDPPTRSARPQGHRRATGGRRGRLTGWSGFSEQGRGRSTPLFL